MCWKWYRVYCQVYFSQNIKIIFEEGTCRWVCCMHFDSVITMFRPREPYVPALWLCSHTRNLVQFWELYFEKEGADKPERLQSRKSEWQVIQELFHGKQTWGYWNSKSIDTENRGGRKDKSHSFKFWKVFILHFFYVPKYSMSYLSVYFLILNNVLPPSPAVDLSRFSLASPSPGNLLWVSYHLLPHCHKQKTRCSSSASYYYP